MEIIGLSGYARSGKDEAAKVLVEEFGFTRIAFADKLREFLYALNPIVSETWEYGKGESKRIHEAKESIRVQDVIDAYTWDGYKETRFGPEIRRLLQRLGTEAGREVISDSIWVDAAFDTDAEKIVVTDCRFPNEADAIVSRGGAVARITRSGIGPVNNHKSETSLDDYPFSYRIDNNGTLAEFKDKIRAWYV